MICRLMGIIVEKKPDHAIVDVNGIGYFVSIPLTTYNFLSEVGTQETLYTSLIHKEDRMELYGFKDQESLQLFKLLLSVSGIGPKLGLVLLSNLTPDELRRNVQEQNIDKMKRISGIGPKKAEKILFELKGKVKEIGKPISASEAADATENDLYLALVSLGYSEQESDRVMKKNEVRSQKTLEEKIREALKHIGKGS